MSGLPGCPAAAVGCKRQRNKPYDWLWDADAESITAMLNFVDYDGPPLRSTGHAVEALTSHSSLFGGEDRGQWRFRLGKGRNRIKRTAFASSVRAGMRWDGPRRGPKYVDYLNQPWPPQPVEPWAAVFTPPPPDFDAAIASGGVSPNQPAAAPPAPAPPAPAPKPPKPVVPPNPGPAPAKPSGERFAAQHPFTAAELQLCDGLLKDLIQNRARNFPEASDQSQAFMCMWQVATLCRPDDALGGMHTWVLRLFRSLVWRGVRMGSSPRRGCMNDHCEVIRKALENDVCIFAPLDGTSGPSHVVDEQAAAQYIKKVTVWEAARLRHTQLAKALAEWWLERHDEVVPEAPDPEDCVATGKVTTWEERDRALRQQVVCLDDCGACASCMRAGFADPMKADGANPE